MVATVSRRILLLLCVCTLGIVSGASAQAATYCDPMVDVSAIGDHRYRPRPHSAPTRCEGLVREGRAGIGSLDLVGLHDEWQDYDPGSVTSVQLEWDVLPAGEATLTAIGLRPGLHYRMDTRVTGTTFRWPAELIGPLRIAAHELGVTAQIAGLPDIRVPTGSPILIPVRLRTRPRSSSGGGCFFVVLRSSVDLSSVTYSLVYRGDSTGTRVADSRDVGAAYYPATRPIGFPLPCLERRGLYSLTMRAAAARPDTVVPALRVYFYYG